MEYYFWQIPILVVLLLGVLFIEMRLLYRHIFNRSDIRKLIASASFLRYMVVPVMLMGYIGLVGGMVLVFFPILWYIIFSSLLGIKLFQPEM